MQYWSGGGEEDAAGEASRVQPAASTTGSIQPQSAGETQRMPLSRLSPDDGDCGRGERREEGRGGERREEGNQWPELGGETGEG